MTPLKFDYFAQTCPLIMSFLNPEDLLVSATALPKLALALTGDDINTTCELFSRADIGPGLIETGLYQDLAPIQNLAAHFFAQQNGVCFVPRSPRDQALKDDASLIKAFLEDEHDDLSSHREFFTNDAAKILTLHLNPVKLARVFSDDRATIIACLNQAGFESYRVFMHAQDALKDDEELAEIAFRLSPFSYSYLSPRLKDNRERALAAVSFRGSLLESCPERFQDDDEIVFEAVKKNGSCLQFASLRLRGTHHIVAQAVKTSPMALRFAAPGFEIDDAILDMHMGGY